MIYLYAILILFIIQVVFSVESKLLKLSGQMQPSPPVAWLNVSNSIIQDEYVFLAETESLSMELPMCKYFQVVW